MCLKHYTITQFFLTLVVLHTWYLLDDVHLILELSYSNMLSFMTTFYILKTFLLNQEQEVMYATFF